MTDWYGRDVPKHAHGTINLGEYTSSTSVIMKAVLELYDRIMDPGLLSRRLSITACRVLTDKAAERKLEEESNFRQMDLFADFGEEAQNREKEKEEERNAREKEKRIQEAVLAIKNKYGKNAILKGMNLEEGATAMERNAQVGGHKA